MRTTTNLPAAAIAAITLLSHLAHSCRLTGSQVYLRDMDNIINNTISKRWSHMEPGDGTKNTGDPFYIPFGQLWPGNTLIWCFSDESEWGGAQQANLIRQDIVAAWKLWIAAGVDEQTIIFREGNPAECSPSNQNVLDVIKGSLFSTVGHFTDGNVISLSDSPTSALGDRIANFAHEIGHAWGMLHEHQRNNLWSYKYAGGKGFTDKWKFNCENVDGYDAWTHGLTDDEISLICTSYTEAKKGYIGSSGQSSNQLHLEEWLPLPKSFWQVSGGPSDYDEDSVMLYPSNLGGEADPDNNWQKKIVYTKADGTLITANTAPSVYDAEGLSDMYPKAEPDDTPCLLTDPCNPQEAAFRAAQGSGSCSS
ncbi:hypothetical protein B0T17DRAFT_532177 [Bombardia bombarda]|uniref:Metalloendopeptidase n=1 Tax=Bombardia bombarda TaxID=252184 RepID=A0AA40C4L5_9PEZI|nr:hypothetical protein B0T17DRAFT_532177 [Bombardia bombarda]